MPGLKGLVLATTIVPTHASREGKRLEFLDAARGIAAFAVMVQHSLESAAPSFLPWSVHHLNFGAFGVVFPGERLHHPCEYRSIWEAAVILGESIFPPISDVLGKSDRHVGLGIFQAVSAGGCVL